jgi:hypothetical protein
MLVVSTHKRPFLQLGTLGTPLPRCPPGTRSCTTYIHLACIPFLPATDLTPSYPQITQFSALTIPQRTPPLLFPLNNVRQMLGFIPYPHLYIPLSGKELRCDLASFRNFTTVAGITCNPGEHSELAPSVQRHNRRRLHFHISLFDKELSHDLASFGNFASVWTAQPTHCQSTRNGYENRTCN